MLTLRGAAVCLCVSLFGVLDALCWTHEAELEGYYDIRRASSSWTGDVWLRSVELNAVGTASSPAGPDAAENGSSPSVIAHRGSCGAMPEETMAAFELAVLEGANLVECDAVMTRDSALLCRHEPNLALSTNVANQSAQHPDFGDRLRTYRIDTNPPETGYFTPDFTYEETQTLLTKQLHQYRDQNFNWRFRIPTVSDHLCLIMRSNLWREQAIINHYRHERNNAVHNICLQLLGIDRDACKQTIHNILLLNDFRNPSYKPPNHPLETTHYPTALDTELQAILDRHSSLQLPLLSSIYLAGLDVDSVMCRCIHSETTTHRCASQHHQHTQHHSHMQSPHNHQHNAQPSNKHHRSSDYHAYTHEYAQLPGYALFQPNDTDPLHTTRISQTSWSLLSNSDRLKVIERFYTFNIFPQEVFEYFSPENLAAHNLNQYRRLVATYFMLPQNNTPTTSPDSTDPTHYTQLPKSQLSNPISSRNPPSTLSNQIQKRQEPARTTQNTQPLHTENDYETLYKQFLRNYNHSVGAYVETKHSAWHYNLLQVSLAEQLYTILDSLGFTSFLSLVYIESFDRTDLEYFRSKGPKELKLTQLLFKLSDNYSENCCVASDTSREAEGLPPLHLPSQTFQDSAGAVSSPSALPRSPNAPSAVVQHSLCAAPCMNSPSVKNPNPQVAPHNYAEQFDDESLPLKSEFEAAYFYSEQINYKTFVLYTVAANLTDVASYAVAVGPPKDMIWPFDPITRYIQDSTGFVEASHKSGLLVHPYTFRNEYMYIPFSFVQDPARELSLYYFYSHVDGLFTDFPGTSVELLSRRRGGG